MIVNVESQRKSGCGTNTSVGIDGSETTALLSSKVNNSGGNNSGGNNNYKGRNNFNNGGPVIQCDYCKLKGHTKDNCYKLHGYPADFKYKRKEDHLTRMLKNVANIGNQLSDAQYSSHHTTSSSTPPIPVQFFTPEQYNQILQMLNKGKEIESMTNASHMGITGITTALMSNLVDNNWIVDTRAINHTELSNGKVIWIGREEDDLYILKYGGDTNSRQATDKDTLLNHSSIVTISSSTVWGPYRVPTYDGKRYFMTSIDDYSRYTWIFLMNTKVNKLLKDHGIAHQSSCVYTLQQNGVVERSHRYILDMALVLRDPVFQEDIFPFKNMRTGSSPLLLVLKLLEPDSPDVTTPLLPVLDNISHASPNSITREPTPPPYPLQLRRSSRESRLPIWMEDYVVQQKSSSCSYPISNYVVCDHLSPTYRASLAAYLAIIEPRTYSESSTNPLWVATMNSEISALENDLLVTDNNLKLIEKDRKDLQTRIKIKDLRELKYFLDIKFSRSEKGVHMCQRKYALEMISETGLS
ncbi:uncharacterized protein LOC142182005 [Nicotiana tabacum]|uniref:Uncharacterized protein LOC142182005 n=1 Tax=Nicotiana tabacum TaxID=4097 RepID=A0AC58UQV4_TOBAC